MVDNMSASNPPAFSKRDDSSPSNGLSYDASELDRIRQAFAFNSSAILSSAQGKRLVSGLLAHFCDDDAQRDRTLLPLLVQLHSLVYRSFANAVSGFERLHSVDQANLLERNSRRHLAYLLSEFIAAGSGSEQVGLIVQNFTLYARINVWCSSAAVVVSASASVGSSIGSNPGR